MKKKAALIPIIIIGIVGVIFLILSSPWDTDDAPSPHSVRPVVAGEDYYVLVTLIELAPRRLVPESAGKLWDVNEKGPDIFYKVYWQGNSVYESPVEWDTLIGRWSALTVDLVDIIRNKGVSPAKVIKAAKIQARNVNEPGSDFVVKVYDKDMAFHDFAGSRTFTLVDLHEDDQEFVYDGQALKRMRIRVVCQSKPLGELIQELNRP